LIPSDVTVWEFDCLSNAIGQNGNISEKAIKLARRPLMERSASGVQSQNGMERAGSGTLLLPWKFILFPNRF
jgi:hypothetical protein